MLASILHRARGWLGTGVTESELHAVHMLCKTRTMGEQRPGRTFFYLFINLAVALCLASPPPAPNSRSGPSLHKKYEWEG